MYDRIKAFGDAIGDAASSVKDKSLQVADAVASQAAEAYDSVRDTLLEKFASAPDAAEKAVPRGAADKSEIEDAARRAVPVIWLVGKTGAGKTSVIAALTGSPHAEVGTGYKPCTKTSQLFDFPADAPLLRFLDTRGLGEAGYDHKDDMEACRRQSGLVIAVLNVADASQQCVIDAIASIRAAQPEFPVLVVQTCLHQYYLPEGSDHPPVYPFDGTDADGSRPDVAPQLRSSLIYQRKLFAGLEGPPPTFVAVDFTKPEDGFTPQDYGRDALIDGLLTVAPEAVRLMIQLEFQEKEKADTAPREKESHRHVLYWASAAAAVGAAPIVGVLTVPAAQAAMLSHLASDYGVDWTVADASALVGLLGLAVVANQGMLLILRQVAKIGVATIPFVAAQDYAVTYALGCAARVFLRARASRTEAKAEEVKQAFYKGLQAAFRRGGGTTA